MVRWGSLNFRGWLREALTVKGILQEDLVGLKNSNEASVNNEKNRGQESDWDNEVGTSRPF